MDRTLGEWGRKGIGHWVNGVGEEKWSLGEKNGEEPEWKKRRMARDGQ